MLIDLKKTLVMLGSSALLFGACGDDDDTKAGADAAVVVQIDAAKEVDVDADLPDPPFSGTLSLAEVSVSNPEAIAVGGIAGGVANISFTNPADVTVAPSPGYTNNIGACRIFVYDVAGGDKAAAGSDGGPVSVTGTENGPFACAFNTDLKSYVCSSTDAAAANPIAITSSQIPIGTGEATLKLTDADFSGANYVGMWIAVSGFPDAAANGRFPIMGNPANDTLIIFNPGLMAASAVADTAGAYQTFVGQGPFPGSREFLDDGTNDVTFTKDAIADAPAIDSTLTANGQGFELAEGSTLAHALPTDGTAATFSCEGSCGTAKGSLKGIIVFGETTDGDLTGTQFNAMPEPVAKYATFQCSGIAAESITLDAGAMALLLGTNPTRIQTSITYANAQAGTNNILLSHGVVGFTTVPPT